MSGIECVGRRRVRRVSNHEETPVPRERGGGSCPCGTEGWGGTHVLVDARYELGLQGGLHHSHELDEVLHRLARRAERIDVFVVDSEDMGLSQALNVAIVEREQPTQLLGRYGLALLEASHQLEPAPPHKK